LVLKVAERCKLISLLWVFGAHPRSSIESLGLALPNKVVEQELLLKLSVPIKVVEPSLWEKVGLKVKLVFESVWIEEMVI
jgi:hypothetical protein